MAASEGKRAPRTDLPRAAQWYSAALPCPPTPTMMTSKCLAWQADARLVTTGAGEGDAGRCDGRALSMSHVVNSVRTWVPTLPLQLPSHRPESSLHSSLIGAVAHLPPCSFVCMMTWQLQEWQLDAIDPRILLLSTELQAQFAYNSVCSVDRQSDTQTFR